MSELAQPGMTFDLTVWWTNENRLRGLNIPNLYREAEKRKWSQVIINRVQNVKISFIPYYLIDKIMLVLFDE
jgi:hypothetical protein